MNIYLFFISAFVDIYGFFNAKLEVFLWSDSSLFQYVFSGTFYRRIQDVWKITSWEVRNRYAFRTYGKLCCLRLKNYLSKIRI